MAMQVIEGAVSVRDCVPCVATLGFFDGVHKGHQHLIAQLVKMAHSTAPHLSTVVSFWPHPQHILKPKLGLRLLTTLAEKIALLDALGIDRLVILPFDAARATQSAMDFVQKVLIQQLGVKALLLGYDHRFGHQQQGSYASLLPQASTLGLRLVKGHAFQMEKKPVQARIIRDCLQNGQVEQATNYLGRPYQFSATVQHGQKKGRVIGYPTANLSLDHKDKLIPKDGVYAARVRIHKHLYRGMLYIGKKRTPLGSQHTIEVNIFNFSADIYGKKLDISLYNYIRPMKVLRSNEALQRALRMDKASVMGYFNAQR